nr:hypothetical protein Iba_scaffold1866CG1080 [Ipomoea batatas]
MKQKEEAAGSQRWTRRQRSTAQTAKPPENQRDTEMTEAELQIASPRRQKTSATTGDSRLTAPPEAEDEQNVAKNAASSPPPLPRSAIVHRCPHRDATESSSQRQ